MVVERLQRCTTITESMSLYVSPVMKWQLIQDAPRLRSVIAAVGSSSPAATLSEG